MGACSSTVKVEERNGDSFNVKFAIDRAVPVNEKQYLLLLMPVNNGSLFEVILHYPKFSTSLFCLMACNEKTEAKKGFFQLAERLAPFIKNIESIYKQEILNDILECFRLQPSWTAAHVATELELIDCFDNDEFMKDMERHLSEEELTPLHIACKDGKGKSIMKLSKKKFGSLKDALGNTPLHYLVENHPEMIEKVETLANSVANAGEQFKASLNVLNNFNESPVHIAIRSSQPTVLQHLLNSGADDRIKIGHMYPIHLALKNAKLDCIKVLIKQCPECICDRDTKYNAPPLHWVRSPQMVDLLMSFNAELNACGVNNETALHVMATLKRLDCAIALISYGINVNSVCDHGKNALHHAVEARDPDMVKALLLFSIDHELKDKNGCTPIDLAKKLPGSSETTDILTIFEELQRGKCRYDKQQEFESLQKEQKSDMNKKDQSERGSILKRKTGKEAVLCLDGGGIKGLVLTELLFGLEEVTGHQAKDLFDWISGASTGSYVALAMADGKSIEHCQRAYFRMKQRVFEGSRPYPSGPLEKFLIDEFGEDKKMNSIEYPRLVIPGVMADRKPAVLHLFRNYDADYDPHFWMRDTRFARPRKPHELEMWRAARCSGAAPTYFRAMDRYIDGGLIANNPTLDVLAEIHKYNKFKGKTITDKDFEPSATVDNVITSADVTTKGTNDNVGVIISLGTGRAPLEASQGIDLFIPSSILETTQIIDNTRSFGELLVHQVTNSDDHVVDRALSWCEMVGLNYFRLNPVLSANVELNEGRGKALIQMMWDTRVYLRKNRDTLVKAGRVLLGGSQ
eukprot:gene8938-9891_t